MVAILREAEGTMVAEAAKKNKINEPTIYTWRKHFGQRDAWTSSACEHSRPRAPGSRTCWRRRRWASRCSGRLTQKNGEPRARRDQLALARARGLSQWQACGLLSILRSALSHELRLPIKDAPVIEAMKTLSALNSSGHAILEWIARPCIATALSDPASPGRTAPTRASTASSATSTCRSNGLVAAQGRRRHRDLAAPLQRRPPPRQLELLDSAGIQVATSTSPDRSRLQEWMARKTRAGHFTIRVDPYAPAVITEEVVMRHLQSSTRVFTAITGAILFTTLAASIAHADDPLQPIISTIRRDREKSCHDTSGAYANFQYNKQLEAVAQSFARSEKKPETAPAGFIRLFPFLGAGDPQSQAITRAYQHGAARAIGDCSLILYGVGFVRHDDRSVDVVTMVFGVPDDFNFIKNR